MVQGEGRAELARAMLSRSPYSPLHLKCDGKVTHNSYGLQLWGSKRPLFNTSLTFEVFASFYRKHFTADSADCRRFFIMFLKTTYTTGTILSCPQIPQICTDFLSNRNYHKLSRNLIRNTFFADDTNEIGRRRAIPRAESLRPIGWHGK